MSDHDVDVASSILEAAAFDPHNLPNALDQAARALNTRMMYLLRIETEKVEIVGPPEASEYGRAYLEGEWWREDVLTSRTRASNRTGVICDHEVVPEELRRSASIYNEFHASWGVSWFAGWKFALAGEQWAFTLARDDKMGGAFSPAEIEALTRLAPIANRALMLAHRIRGMRATGWAESLEAAGYPCVLLDQTGGVLFASASAEALFEPDFGVRAGKLWARDETTNADLLKLATLAKSRIQLEALPNVLVRRLDGVRPLLLLPVRVSGLGLDMLPGARVVLMMVDLESRSQPKAELLRALFHFSEAEIRVAQGLCLGLSIEAIGGQLSLKSSSVRQIVKSLLTKTETHRQAELVALLSRLPSTRD